MRANQSAKMANKANDAGVAGVAFAAAVITGVIALLIGLQLMPDLAAEAQVAAANQSVIDSGAAGIVELVVFVFAGGLVIAAIVQFFRD